MKIAIDLDEVTVDLLKEVNEYYNNKHDTDFKLSDFHNYDWWEIWGIPLDDAVNEFYSFMESPESRKIQPIYGAIESIEKLRSQNDVVIITARQNEIKEMTLEWVQEYIPGLEKHTYFTNHLSRISKHVKKSEIALELNVDLLIDDQLRNAYDCAENGIKVLLYNQPWNQNLQLNKNITRVYSWKNALQMLNIS
jgi:uncharacterized HAD superfamily protein